MQLSEALALAIEALRADAASARDGIAPDHESADRDQAASDELEHVLGSIRSGDDIADMIESRIEAAGGGQGDRGGRGGGLARQDVPGDRDH